MQIVPASTFFDRAQFRIKTLLVDGSCHGSHLPSTRYKYWSYPTGSSGTALFGSSGSAPALITPPDGRSGVILLDLMVLGAGIPPMVPSTSGIPMKTPPQYRTPLYDMQTISASTANVNVVIWRTIKAFPLRLFAYSEPLPPKCCRD